MSNCTKHYATEPSAREENGLGTHTVPNEILAGPSTVEELSGLLFKVHPPLIYDPPADGLRRPSPGVATSARLGARSPYRTSRPPSGRQLGRTRTCVNMSVNTTIYPPMTFESTPVQSPISLAPSHFFGERHPDTVCNETPAAAACQQPLVLHPPFVLAQGSSPADSTPPPHSSPDSSATDVCDTTSDTALDVEDDSVIFDPEKLLSHRRLVTAERQAANAKVGRIYRRVRVRRSKETARSKHRRREREERSMTIDSYLVPTMDQRPPRYARRRTPEPEERIIAQARRAKLKVYQSSATTLECGMAWSPTHSPISE